MTHIEEMIVDILVTHQSQLRNAITVKLVRDDIYYAVRRTRKGIVIEIGPILKHKRLHLILRRCARSAVEIYRETTHARAVYETEKYH